MNTTIKLLVAAAAWLMISTTQGGGEPLSSGDDADIKNSYAISTDYQVTMTWISSGKRYASIDGEFYKTGDELPDGGRVLAIEPGLVTLATGGGETFAVEIAQRLPASKLKKSGDEDSSPSAYIDNAIDELTLAKSAVASTPAEQARLDMLGALRDRLIAVKTQLGDGSITDVERQRIDLALGQDWLIAQRKLDPLRRSILDSGRPLGAEELMAAQRILEDAMLASLKPALDRHNPSGVADVDASRPGELLDTVKALLGSYPDYHALVDQLEQLSTDAATNSTSSLPPAQEIDSDLVNSFGSKPDGE